MDQDEMVVGIGALDDKQAEFTVRDYVCAWCWGNLLKFPAPKRMWFVRCSKHLDETPGYVTKRYAERRRGESVGEKVDAKYNIGEQLGITTKRTQKQNLADLGF